MKGLKVLKYTAISVFAGAWLTAMGLGASAWFGWGDNDSDRDQVRSVDAAYDHEPEDRNPTLTDPEPLISDDESVLSKIASPDEWVTRCSRQKNYDENACRVFVKLFYNSGMTPEDVEDFRRQGFTDPVAMLKITRACEEGSCKVASSGEISGDDAEGSPADFAARCKNVGIEDIDDCAEFARADSSPAHYRACVDDGVRDAYACILMRKNKISPAKVRRWLDVWDEDTELTDCEDDPLSRPDPTPWRHKNLQAIFSYLSSDQEIPERAIHPPETSEIPPTVAYAFQKACVAPREAYKLYSYGVTPEYYTGMNSITKVGTIEVLISAWYSCITVDEVRAEIENGAERLYEAVQKIDSRRNPHKVRELLRSMDRRDCKAVLEEMGREQQGGTYVDDLEPSFPMKIPLAPNPYE